VACGGTEAYRWYSPYWKELEGFIDWRNKHRWFAWLYTSTTYVNTNATVAESERHSGQQGGTNLHKHHGPSMHAHCVLATASPFLSSTKNRNGHRISQPMKQHVSGCRAPERRPGLSHEASVVQGHSSVHRLRWCGGDSRRTVDHMHRAARIW
jgi:hypothetical protein